ncbi:type II toxin-antitoxin system VapC family toxin [Agromyces larvae]|uniref:Type II toxin-antitoxin system VapC family toxin n=1 Tax=Agromyces larvae TaxID=2929802 RepID=A0ABY4C195_9MICO|nr:hypothetical protein [Agromyces larvae]UOE43906.1 hypothetical protein MTO99_17355 [Agromyces larvae]
MAGLEHGTRFAIDAVTARRLVRDDPGIGARQRLVGPSMLRSDVLSMLYREALDGQLDEATARIALERVATLKIRLLGDRVSRATAWRIARQLDHRDIRSAEYLAVATLQADVLVAGDEQIAAAASGIIPLGTYEDLVG